MTGNADERRSRRRAAARRIARLVERAHTTAIAHDLTIARVDRRAGVFWGDELLAVVDIVFVDVGGELEQGSGDDDVGRS